LRIAEWDDEKCLNLIEIYRNNPLLWDPKDRNYYKKHMKGDAWDEISVAMHTTGSDCKQKMVSLLASFRRKKNFAWIYAIDTVNL
jgi:hypothetical protein